MTTISCPSCGFTFETAATTNTRCRRCRKVVRIGAGQRAARSYVDTADDEEEPSGGGAWALAALAAGAALAFWLGTRGN